MDTTQWTDRDIDDFVRRSLPDLTTVDDYNVNGIVRMIIDTFDTVDPETLPTRAYWAMVAANHKADPPITTIRATTVQTGDLILISDGTAFYVTDVTVEPGLVHDRVYYANAAGHTRRAWHYMEMDVVRL